MIDHVLGRPSSRFRKIQVFLVLSFWTTYLFRGDHHGPPLIRRLSARLSPKLTAWQTVTLTMLYLYFARNFAKIFGLECPEPLANLYSRSYFRATWFMTALDAGFWTAMPIRRKWLRDIASIVFSAYYLIAAEQADEKVRKVRATVTVEHLRVSWEKSSTPYIKFITTLLHPFRTRYAPRHLKIQRPKESGQKEPVDVWIYFEGSSEELKAQKKIVLDIPGGGFVAMGPRNHDDKLMGWSKKLKIPVVSIEYRKAPEYPYPYGLNECYDVYHSIITTKGRCMGLSGEAVPRIAMSGDSAGGNLCAGVALMILNAAHDDLDGRQWTNMGLRSLPPPEGLLLVYPSLDLNINSWMTDEQVRLIRERSTRETNRGIMRKKSAYFARTSGQKLPMQKSNPKAKAEDYDSSDSEYEDVSSTTSTTAQDIQHLHVIAPHPNTPDLPHQPPHTSSLSSASAALEATKPPTLSTRLAMTSRLTYFNDRILTPEMMRAMVILYIGPHNRPDFSTDFLLSPLVAPEALLRRFPKTYFLTGERDPLVDDTVLFAGRIRQAKSRWAKERRDMGLQSSSNRSGATAADAMPEVRLIPGSSHGFLLMAGVLPQAIREIVRCARWLEEILADKPEAGDHLAAEEGEQRPRHHYRTDTGTTSVGMESTDDEGDMPLEMATPSPSGAAVALGKTRGVAGRGGAKVRGRGRRGSHVLGSEEDLVGRRMQGLMGGLTGLEDRESGGV